MPPKRPIKLVKPGPNKLVLKPLPNKFAPKKAAKRTK